MMGWGGNVVCRSLGWGFTHATYSPNVFSGLQIEDNVFGKQPGISAFR